MGNLFQEMLLDLSPSQKKIERQASPPVAMTIAGSDSGGGAGLQADLKTFAALATHGVSATTLITAQNTQKVAFTQVLPFPLIRAQLDAVTADFDIKATKCGALGDSKTISQLVEWLEDHPPALSHRRPRDGLKTWRFPAARAEHQDHAQGPASPCHLADPEPS